MRLIGLLLNLAAVLLLAGCGDQDPLSSGAPEKTAAKLTVSENPVGGGCDGPDCLPGFESVANFNLQKPVADTQGNVTIDGSVEAGRQGMQITRLVWNWGDGSSSESDPPAVHVYDTAGPHQINVTAYNNIGETQQMSFEELFIPATVVSTPEDIAALAGITSIAGDLTVRKTQLTDLNVSDNPSLASISFPSLTTVASENIYIGNNTALTTMNFSSLESVGTHVNVSGNPALISVSFPALMEVVNENVYIGDNAALTSISFAALERIGTHLNISNNPLLTGLAMPLLSTVGENVSIQNNAVLATIDLRGLSSVIQFVGITDNPQLVDLDLSGLSSVGENLFVQNCGLTSIGLPSLTTVGGFLSISNNSQLTSIDLSSVSSIGDNLSINTNPLLPTGDAQAIEAAVVANGVTAPVYLFDNGS